jgi:hypothetical protein
MHVTALLLLLKEHPFPRDDFDFKRRTVAV